MINLNLFLISEYVKRITKNDIKRFALKEGITLTEFEVNIINEYIINYYKTFIFGNPKGYLDELKKQVEPLTYNKIETLYKEFRDKIDNYR